MGITSFSEAAVRRYERLVYPERVRRRDIGAALYERLAPTFGNLSRLRVIEPGIGGGWITAGFLTGFLTDQTKQQLEELQLVGVDTAATMLERFRKLVEEEIVGPSAAFDHSGSLNEGEFILHNRTSSRKVSVRLVNSEFLTWSVLRETYDVCLSLFFLHHLDRQWRRGLSRIVDMLNPQGIIVLAEMDGDHACWSNSFDKVQRFSDLAENRQRLAYLKAIKLFQDKCEEFGWHNYRSISASNVRPVIERLERAGFVKDKDAIEQSYELKCRMADWFDGDDRMFSVFPRDLPSGVRSQLTTDLKTGCQGWGLNWDDEIVAWDVLKLHILRRQHAGNQESEIPEVAASRDITARFSGLRLAADEEAAYRQWEKDLNSLLVYQVIDNPSAVFAVQWNLDGLAAMGVPLVCKGEVGIKRVLLYYWLLEKYVKGAYVTKFVGQDMPEKAEIVLQHGSDATNVDVRLERDGSVRAITVSLPPTLVRKDFAKKCAHFVDETSISGMDLKPRPLLGLEPLLIVDNKALVTLATNGGFAPEGLDVQDGSVFDDSEIDKAAKELTNAFKLISNFRSNSRWSLSMERSRELIRAFAVSGLTGATQIGLHFSRDALRRSENAGADTEVAAGGIIVYHDKSTRVSHDLLITLLNLANRAATIERHTEFALLRPHFDRQILEEMLRNPAQLIPRTRLVTVCFWDIRAFSLLCSNLVNYPNLISGFLEDYFNAASDVIQNKHHGVLDKFIGDGVMGLFMNIRDPNDDIGRGSAIAAVRAAIDLKDRFDAILTSWKETWKGTTGVSVDLLTNNGQKVFVKLGCGIHTNNVLWGKFGGKDRMQITALGPAVNVAQRLESCAGKGKGDILISATTKSRLEGETEFKIGDEMEFDAKGMVGAPNAMYSVSRSN